MEEQEGQVCKELGDNGFGYRHTGLEVPKRHSTKTKVGEKGSSGKVQLMAYLFDVLLV